MGKKIIDKFTNLRVSRERKKQLRYIRDRRCPRCGTKRKKSP